MNGCQFLFPYLVKSIQFTGKSLVTKWLISAVCFWELTGFLKGSVYLDYINITPVLPYLESLKA